MKQVGLTWTPSTSIYVESQIARIVNADTLEIYGEASLAPTANAFSAEVPQGVVVQGSVTTIRGEESITAVSDSLEISYDPLEAATGVNIGLIA